MSGDEGNFDWLKLEQCALELAETSPGDAYCMQGMLYEAGLPGFEDDKVVEGHYRKAIEAGNEGCAFYLARVLLGREEEDISYKEVRELQERAERVNPSAAAYDLLGTVCQELGDDAAAVKCFQKLHRLDPSDSECCLELARAYALGAGVRQDDEIALRYFQKVANLGDSYGMHMVGVMYYDGLGVRRNYKRAVDYFRRALEHGETQALYYLSTCYRDGIGVRQDVDKAWQYLAEGIKDGVSACRVAQGMLELDEAATSEELDRVAPLLEKARTMLDVDDEEMLFQLELLEGAFEIKREKLTAGVSADESGKR